MHPSLASKEGLDETECDWVQATIDNPDEQERLQSMATDLIRAFVRDELKHQAAVNEVVCLAPVLNQEDFRKLLQLFVDGINNSALLEITITDGPVRLIRNSGPRDFDANDLVKILELLGARLKGTHDQSTQQIYKLMLAVSAVLDSIADGNVEGLGRDQLHEPLFKCLEGLQARPEPYLLYQAAYAFQALEYIPNDESRLKLAQRHTENLLMAALGIVKVARSLDFSGLIGGLKRIHESLVEVTKPIVFTIKANSESEQSFLSSLKEGFRFKRAWYPALRALDIMLQDCRLSEFRELVCKAPCRRDPAFQLGVCQRLGLLAVNPLWDDVSRQGAVDFLGEIYKNDGEWGRHDNVNKWILHILHQLKGSAESTIQQRAQTLVQDLGANGDTKKRSLYQECTKELPSSYPLMIALPPETSLLLKCVQNKPSVEITLSKLRQERLKVRGGELYISPRAKRTLNAKDDFDLTANVQEFLKSDKKVFLLLGDSGAGKSTFNRALETDLWDKYMADGRIPLFIHLPSIDNPEQDLVAKQLRKVNFTEDQIRELKLHHEFILICDGYDETQLTRNLYMSNELNQTGGWRAQMVISCRTEYNGMNYEDRFQPIDRNIGGVSEQFQEAAIVPFNKDQIRGFIEQYVSQSKSCWSTENYENALKNIPNLQDLVKNPFLLRLAMDVLPQRVDLKKNFTSQRVTRIVLYDEFVAQWLERNKKRLMELKMKPKDAEAFDTLCESDFNQRGIAFFRDLAAAIYIHHGGKPVVSYNNDSDQGTWKEPFFSKRDGRHLLREAIPLVRNGDRYQFIHKSVLEYGLCLAIFDPNRYTGRMQQMPTTSRRGTERVQQQPAFKDQLLASIEQSKVDKSVRIPAANAITILVRARVQFNGADLRGIKVPRADLSNGVFDSVQLEGADLRKVNLRNIWLRKANLRGAQMTGVLFGELPLLKENGAVICCAFSLDWKKLVVGIRNHGINLYETANWSKIGTLKVPIGEVMCPLFSPTRSWIVYGEDSGKLSLWDADTGNFIHNFVGQSDNVAYVSISPKGDQIASASFDGTVKLWDVSTSECIRIFHGHYGMAFTGVYSPKGDHIASGGADGIVHLWNVDTGDCIQTLQGHSGFIQSVVYSPKGDQIASASNDHTVRLWDISNAQCIQIMQGHTSDVLSVAYSPKGDQVASGSFDKTVRIWDVDTGDCLQTLQGHTDGVKSVIYTPKGDQIVSGSYDRTVRFWDIEFGNGVSTSHGHDGSVLSVAYSPKGNEIASVSSNKTVRLWNLETGECIHSTQSLQNNCGNFAYSPNGGRIAFGFLDGTVQIWNVDTGDCVHTLEGHSKAIYAVVYSPKGDQIVSGSGDKTVRLWEADSGNCIHIFRGHSANVYSVIYSPKGDRVASGSLDETLRLWDVDSGNCVRILQVHSGGVYGGGVCSVAYSPRGDQIAFGGLENTVRIWEVDSDNCVHTLEGHSSGVNSVAYTPKGDWIASGSADWTVRCGVSKLGNV
ncbi:hypothetical protein BGX26_007987 [Mortierella sp. AD094]|nr:hypothetical protein BGX26_007987 [Mortierella sp. AD094]